jgi:hypothetical protein
MDINVKGAWLSLKHEISAMLENGGGAIVNQNRTAISDKFSAGGCGDR